MLLFFLLPIPVRTMKGFVCVNQAMRKIRAESGCKNRAESGSRETSPRACRDEATGGC